MYIRSFLWPRVHKGVQLISWATAIRWIGWGFVEALMPIFIFSFAGSYSGTGILGSVYSIVYLLTVPIVGLMANRIRVKYIIFAGLLFYPFIGLSYYLAGLLNMAVFIIIAKGLNGVSYALDQVGRNTYVRKHSKKSDSGSAFGYMWSVSNFWFVAAILGSAVLVNYFEIYELFLLIIPTDIIAIYLVSKIPKDKMDNDGYRWRKFLSLHSYRNFIRELFIWKKNLKKLAVLTFVIGATFAAIEVFMPVFLFLEGDSFQDIIIFVLVYSVPALFSSYLGWVADHMRHRSAMTAVIILSILLIILANTTLFSFQLLLIFLISLMGSFIGVFIESEMTRQGDDRKYGSLSSATLEIGEVASIVGPISVGFLIDAYSMETALILMAGLLIFSTLFIRR